LLRRKSALHSGHEGCVDGECRIASCTRCPTEVTWSDGGTIGYLMGVCDMCTLHFPYWEIMAHSAIKISSDQLGGCQTERFALCFLSRRLRLFTPRARATCQGWRAKTLSFSSQLRLALADGSTTTSTKASSAAAARAAAFGNVYLYMPRTLMKLRKERVGSTRLGLARQRRGKSPPPPSSWPPPPSS